MAKKKTSKKTGEALRKEALAIADANIKAIEAEERGEKPVQPKATKKARSKKASATKQPKALRPAKAKKLSGLDAAAQVLAAAKEPLAAKAIADRAIALGWKTNGATPHATLYAAMTREIAAKGREARFKKTGRGLFTSGKKA
jgi:hypothetical protein